MKFNLAKKKFPIKYQWRIQDFLEEGAPTYYFAQIYPKTAWKWKNLDGGGGDASLAPSPPWIRQWVPYLAKFETSTPVLYET